MSLPTIGRAERADFPEIGVKKLPVKIDTGADACSIWAHVVELQGEKLHVVFFDPGSGFYTGEEHVFETGDFSVTRVANSFGHREVRYKVKLLIRVKGRKIRGTFTLSDRSKKLYPVLIGRSLLYNKFLVDVSQGKPLLAAEKARAAQLKADMEILQGGEL